MTQFHCGNYVAYRGIISFDLESIIYTFRFFTARLRNITRASKRGKQDHPHGSPLFSPLFDMAVCFSNLELFSSPSFSNLSVWGLQGVGSVRYTGQHKFLASQNNAIDTLWQFPSINQRKSSVDNSWPKRGCKSSCAFLPFVFQKRVWQSLTKWHCIPENEITISGVRRCCSWICWTQDLRLACTDKTSEQIVGMAKCILRKREPGSVVSLSCPNRSSRWDDFGSRHRGFQSKSAWQVSDFSRRREIYPIEAGFRRTAWIYRFVTLQAIFWRSGFSYSKGITVLCQIIKLIPKFSFHGFVCLTVFLYCWCVPFYTGGSR